MTSNAFCKFIAKILTGALVALTPLANASCLAKKLTGVNMSGAEFNSAKIPGVAFKDYTFPTESELTYVAAQGASVIRFPFRWERLQHNALGALDADELKRIKATVASANAKGLCVILDVHNYAKYNAEQLGGNPALQDALVDFWRRVAKEFTDPASVAFGLMNEPNYLPIAEWAPLAKRTLTQLRNGGSTNLVFVAGGRWSGMHDWFVPQNDTSNATAFADLSDPLHRTVIEVHQYADSDYSGTKTDCRGPDEFNDIFSKLTAWAQNNGQQLFLGEFGMPQTPGCMLTLERFLSLMTGSVWKGWSYWAAGGWWGKYPLALNTSMTDPSLQWPILKKYFYTVPASNPPQPPQTLMRKDRR